MSGPATTSAAPIPYRTSAVVSGADVVSSLGLALLVLALFAGASVVARRRGWLDRWLPPASRGDRPKRQLSVVEVLPLSRRTRLLRVRRGDQEWLLAESEGGLRVLRPKDAENRP